MPLAIFGYGSLMDKANLQSRAPGTKHHCTADLRDHRLVFDKPGITHRYLNIQQALGWQVPGVILYVTDAQFVDLARREVGYHVVDVTKKIIPHRELLTGTRVVAFMHLGLPYVRMSYLNRCLNGVPSGLHEAWLASIDFDRAVIEIDEEPICGYGVLNRRHLDFLTSADVEMMFSARACFDLEALRRQA